VDQKKEARKIIGELTRNNFYAECPCCGNPIPLKKAGLFHLDDFTPQAEALYEQKIAELEARRKALREQRKKIKERSETGAKAVNIGFVLERLAPSFKGFPFHRNDCRSLFDPIDCLIFEGLSEKHRVSRLLFVDIKTGRSRLKDVQKDIKECVERKKVELDIYEEKEDET